MIYDDDERVYARIELQVSARLDHVGIVVADFDGLATAFGDVLGLEVRGPETIAELEMDILWVRIGDTQLQFIRPAHDGTRAAEVLRVRGPGIHHLGIAVDALEPTLAALRARGIALQDAVPRPGAHGSLVAFIDPAAVAGTAVELVEPAP